MSIQNGTKISTEKTEQPYVVDVCHYRYRDGEGRELTEYFIRLSDESVWYFKKPKNEENEG